MCLRQVCLQQVWLHRVKMSLDHRQMPPMQEKRLMDLSAIGPVVLDATLFLSLTPQWICWWE